MSIEHLNQRYLDRMREVGIPAPTVHDIVATLNQVIDQRSALRLQAAQGGWLDTDEYVDALQAISDGQQLIRSRYGDDIFERYLYATLEPNRVVVSAIQDERFDATGGLHPGDAIHRLEDARCFSIREFRQRVENLETDGNVLVTVRRGLEFVVLTLPTRQLRQLAVEPGYARP